MTPTLTAIILAAGESKRMRSRRPKVLHPLCGRPLIEYPVQVTRALGARVVLVVGRAADDVRAAVGDGARPHATWSRRSGWAPATPCSRRARPAPPATARSWCCPPTSPSCPEAMLRGLVEHHRATGAAATMLTACLDDPTGYGRVLREGGRPVAIVEHRDATPAQREIREIGTRVYCFDAATFWPALDQVTPQNEQGEYYLTDVIGILRRRRAAASRP